MSRETARANIAIRQDCHARHGSEVSPAGIRGDIAVPSVGSTYVRPSVNADAEPTGTDT